MSRGRSASTRAPARWAPVVGLVVLAAAYALLGRWAKVAILAVVAVAAVVLVLVDRGDRAGASRREQVQRWLPALVPLAIALLIDLQPRIVEVVLSDPTRRWRIGFAAFVVGLVAGLLILAGVDVRRLIERGVHAVTAALRTVVSVVLYVLVLLPLGVAHLWRRDDPLRTGRPIAGSAWHAAVPARAHLADRTYRSERPLQPVRQRRPLTFATRAIGAVVLLLLADVAVGAAWERVSPDPAERTGPNDGISPIPFYRVSMDAPPVQLDASDADELPPDPREDSPAMAKYPWRHEYFQEFQRVTSTYWPYVLWRTLPAEGRYFNIDDRSERRSYEAADSDGAGVPDVDFYGGSTIYGEGQRDEHTISSEVARLAEADGLPIRAHNRGVRGWVNWQEMLLFEQMTADRATRPDLAVFYDGANERSAQDGSIRGVPAHIDLDDTAAQMAGDDAVGTPARLQHEPEDLTAWDHLELLARDYRETSAMARAGRWLHDAVTGEPAGADPAAAGRTAGEPADDAMVARIYRRGQRLIRDIAADADVDVTFFWQPLQNGGWSTYRDGLAPPTIDLSQVLADRDDVFIDGTHHNEDGAAVVAAAMWEHLKPRVQAWYDAR